MRAKRIVLFVVVAVVTLALDQLTKGWARSALVPGVSQPVIDGYWDWDLAYNPGIAFSMFVGATGARVVLSVIATAAIVALTATAAKTEARLHRVALAVIAGGAAGNLVDRARTGVVTDFVRWHLHDHTWPVFNVADVALIAGVGLLVVEGFFARRRERARMTA